MLARAGLAAVAVVVLTWLAVMARDAHVQARGEKALAHLGTPGNAERAQRDLTAARLLNPDTTPDLRLAVLQRSRGEHRRAVATVRRVLRSEPENMMAWSVLLAVALGHDQAAVDDALAARRRLDPLDAR